MSSDDDEGQQPPAIGSIGDDDEEDNNDYEEEEGEEEDQPEADGGDEEEEDGTSAEDEEEEDGQEEGDGGESPEDYEEEEDQQQHLEQATDGEGDERGEAPEQLSTVETNQYGEREQQPEQSIQFEGIVKGALDGFGTGTIGDIVAGISTITDGQGGLSNPLAAGTLGALASQLIGSAAHHFLGINPDTGRVLGAIAGNLIFGLGGRDNSLSGLGKLVLDQLVTGRFHRPVTPYRPPAHLGLPSFQLDFQTERDKCLRERKLFQDPEFPPSDRSLYFSKSPPKHVEWKRPAELVSQPQLLVQQRASRFDVVQGQLGDCWLLAASAALTLREELFFRVVPPDQSFTENYAGIFHFQFWRYGQWVDVVIDDLLPSHNGELLFMHSANGLSFWSALLEKAYAKLYGSYEALKGGTTSEALEDFTGGLIEHFELAEMSREQMLAVLVRGFQMGSFFGCSIDADPEVTEARLANGLVMGHAYSLTALQTVDGPHGQTVLLRVRNPWGEHEWQGAWSDDAPEWNYVPIEQRNRMHLSFAEDGEFWMDLEDFHREFQRMECCNLGPEVLDEICQMMDLDREQVLDGQMGQQQKGQQQHQWSQFAADGEWSTARGTAGGCRNFPTFSNNPQFGTLLSIGNNSNRFSSSPEGDGNCTLICAVLQKYRREMRAQGLDDLPIGFAVFPARKLANEEETQREHQQMRVMAQGSGQQQMSTAHPGGQPNNYYAHARAHLGFGPGYGRPHSQGLAYSAPPPLDPSPHPRQPGKLQRLDQQALEGVKTVAKSPKFINLREVTSRFRVPPGQYVIVPSTFEPDEEGQFLLRIFCSGQLHAEELQ